MGTKKHLFIIGMVIAGSLSLMAIIGLVWTPYDANAMNASLKLSPPSFAHPFGTDHFGRDVFSRVMGGMGMTFLIAAAGVAIGAAIGLLTGALTGYFGGMADEVAMRFSDALTAFPSMLLALIFVAVFGAGKYIVILALGVLFIPSYARMVRSEYVGQKELDYVRSAKVMGANGLRIVFVHILPNIKGTLISSLLIGFNNAVLAEAGMSYLGLGVQPPEPSLGRMLAESQSYLFTAPWFALAPGLIMVAMLLGVGMLGD